MKCQTLFSGGGGGGGGCGIRKKFFLSSAESAQRVLSVKAICFLNEKISEH